MRTVANGLQVLPWEVQAPPSKSLLTASRFLVGKETTRFGNKIIGDRFRINCRCHDLCPRCRKKSLRPNTSQHTPLDVEYEDSLVCVVCMYLRHRSAWLDFVRRNTFFSSLVSLIGALGFAPHGICLPSLLWSACILGTCKVASR